MGQFCSHPFFYTQQRRWNADERWNADTDGTQITQMKQIAADVIPPSCAFVVKIERR